MKEIPRFTNAEVLEAFAAVMPAGEVAGLREEIGANFSDPCRFAISDGMYLVMAALSPEYAQRVVACRPDLAEQVAKVRHHPQEFLYDRRKALRGD